MNFFSPTLSGADSAYLEANAAINSILFDGRFGQSPIYLGIENEVVEKISNKRNHPVGTADYFAGFLLPTGFGAHFRARASTARWWRSMAGAAGSN